MSMKVRFNISGVKRGRNDALVSISMGKFIRYLNISL